jgi:hypothetical protein
MPDPTPAAVAAILARHREEHHTCAECAFPWPCDAASLAAALQTAQAERDKFHRYWSETERQFLDKVQAYIDLKAALATAQATSAQQAAALEWALAEGGWRLWYYATEPLPPGVVRNEIGAPARWAPPPP